MGVAITAGLPKYGMKAGILHERLERQEGAFSFAITWSFCSLCHLLHPARPCLVRRHRNISWRIRSTVDGNRFNTPTPGPSNSSGGPRLIRVIQDLRRKLTAKIQEIKKGLPMKLFFLLVGFYSATAFSTVIGQTGDWDVLSAAFAVLVVECIGALMYRASVPLLNKVRSLITMFNYWKAGLSLGLFLDSFKSQWMKLSLLTWTQVLAASYQSSSSIMVNLHSRTSDWRHPA